MATKRLKLAEPGLVYGEGTERLSQLSDIVSLSQDEPDQGSQPALLNLPLQSSQPGFADLQEPLPSQPLLPTPELPLASQRIDASGAAERPERTLTRFADDAQRTMHTLTHTIDVDPYEAQERKRRVTRRGPMDEMRQLVRILVKVIPQSAKNIKACEEGGGGNRISEEQIKFYLSSTLGEAPQPRWGVPEGWAGYLAELFSWVTGQTISKDDALRCAKRDPGRSWEAIDSELARLRLLPSTWPLPLSKEGLSAALVPTSQDLAAAPSLPKPHSPKRSPDAGMPESPPKRSKLDRVASGRLAESEEIALWTEALQLVHTAASRTGSVRSSLETQAAVAKLKAEIQAALQAPSMVPQPGSVPLFLGSQPPQVVPVACPHGQLQGAYSLQMPSAASLATAASSSCALETSASLDLGGLNPSQLLLSQSGINISSAFQAVKTGSPEKSPAGRDKLGAPLLDAPPPLRLSQPGSADPERAPDSPSTEDDDASAVFNPSQLASPHGGPVSNLFKPTALKSDAALFDRSSSQGDVRPTSSPLRAEVPVMTAAPPLLGYMSNGHFMPLASGPGIASLTAPLQPTFQGQQHMFMSGPASFQAAMSAQPAMLSHAFETARLQTTPWVPNMAATLQ